jgi:vitamin K-dependent gamma-carboxylase
MHPPNRVPVDLAWLVVLRIAAGLGALVVPPLFWRWPHLFDGFLSSGIQIPYPLLYWIVPLPGFGMRLLLILCMIAGLAVILGLCYRIAALVLFAILSYHFLLDSSYYQSTTYLLVLLTGLLALSPAHHLLAFDAQRIPPAQRGRSSGLFLALFRFQLAAVYFFAGIAKLDADWLAGHTLSVMVPQQRLVAMSSSLLSPHGAAVVMSWLGLWFDLLIAPGLLLRRTRTFAIGALLLFHLHNAHTFRLAHLPWGMLFLATVFLEPDWPRRLLKYTPHWLKLPPSPPSRATPRWAVAVAVLYCAVQTVVPLRKWFYPGNAYFTECGFPFSWAMRSRVKSSFTQLLIVDQQTGQKELIPLSHGMHNMQARRAQGDPHAIWWLSQQLATQARHAGRDIAVYARSEVTLNGSPFTPFVAPDVDLSQADFPLLGVPSWLTLQPLPRK